MAHLRDAHSDGIDLPADLNAEDDEGLGWAVLVAAAEPDRVLPAVLLRAGRSDFWAYVRVESVDLDGQVPFRQLPTFSVSFGRFTGDGVGTLRSPGAADLHRGTT